MDKIDFRYGSPDFLHPYWDERKEYIEIYSLPYLEKSSSLSYQYEPIPELVDSIKKLHIDHKNANTQDKYLLIGNGATQVLMALFYAIGKSVYANPPFYPRFPLLVSLSKCHWYKDNQSLQIITNPNNPDNGLVFHEETDSVLYDLSYNWSMYTTPICYNKDIMVFSLSKSLGFASTRVGWAWIKDKALYDKAKHYIELTTSGVSVASQHLAYKAIQYTLHEDYKVFDFGRNSLIFRWTEFNKCSKLFKVLNNSGMYAWCKGKVPDELDCFLGTQFGFKDNDYFRINLGCSRENFDKLLCILKRKS